MGVSQNERKATWALLIVQTQSQASVTKTVAFTAERVLFVFMALPFSVDSTLRAYRLKAGNADFPISTEMGTSPFAVFPRVNGAEGRLTPCGYLTRERKPCRVTMRRPP